MVGEKTNERRKIVWKKYDQEAFNELLGAIEKEKRRGGCLLLIHGMMGAWWKRNDGAEYIQELSSLGYQTLVE